MSLVIPKSFWAHTFVCKNIRKLIYWAGALANFFVILLTDSWAFVSKTQPGRSRKSCNKKRHMFFPIMHFETPRACHFRVSKGMVHYPTAVASIAQVQPRVGVNVGRVLGPQA